MMLNVQVIVIRFFLLVIFIISSTKGPVDFQENELLKHF